MNEDAKRDRLLERTLEVERSVLGGILVDADLLNDAREHVTEADFFRAGHRMIFEAMLRLANAGKPVDPMTVQQELTAVELEAVGGPVYLTGLLDGVPRGLNVGHYAWIVRGRSTLRAVERIARQMLLDAGTAEDDPSAILEDAERALFALRERSTQVEIATPRKRASATFQQLEALTAAGGALRGVPTGLKDLDADLRGLHHGNLIVIGARPSMGKSALALTLAMNGAKATERPALFFSLEMSADELNLREITMRAQINSWRLTHGWASENEQRRLAESLEEMQDGGVHLVDAPLLTVGQMRAISRRAKATHGLSLVVIDYLQLIHAERKKGERSAENRTLELGEMSRSLKGLARDLNVPVVLLSQLSRAVESRADKRPQLSDLRESGAIEQDADVVLLLCRPAFYRDLAEKYAAHYCEVNVAKQRNGPTGLVKLAFWKEQTRFSDYVEAAA